MKYSYAALALSLGALGRATPIHQRSKRSCAVPVCTTLVLPIQAQAYNKVLPPYPNDTSPGVMYEYLNSLDTTSLSSQLVSGTWDISATFCEPTVTVPGREETVQFLLHGLSYTKQYWSGMGYDSPNFEGEYSWVSHAASQGYATLAIDNLGNGNSTRPDPLNVVQGSLQLAVLAKIIEGLRQGSFPNIQRYEKIIMACHSYGSVMGRLLATYYPTAGADAYILTAASAVLSGLTGLITDFNVQSASAVDPRFPNLAPGYVAVDKNAIRDTTYGLDGDFDPGMAQADADSPHVFAVGEIALSSGAVPTNYTGPVLVLTGRNDQVVCGNGNITSEVPDCGVGIGSVPYNESTLFQKASRFDAYAPDRVGHNVNLHYAAPEAFGAAHEWLQSVGF